MARVGIITYTVPHRKSLDLAFQLRRKGFNPTFFAFPFKIKPDSFIKHSQFQERPYPILDFDFFHYCNTARFNCIPISGWDDLGAMEFAHHADSYDLFITCISKIIPASFLDKAPIINAHPGILPYNRGVDAFKRSILNKWPVGITIHQVDENIDAGQILSIYLVPVFPDDTLALVADRSFRAEIELLSDVPGILNTLLEKSVPVDTSYSLSKSHISADDDLQVPLLFEQNIDLFVKMSVSRP